MESEIIENITLSFSAATNINSWRGKSALSNVVSLGCCCLYIKNKRRKMDTRPNLLMSSFIGLFEACSCCSLFFRIASNTIGLYETTWAGCFFPLCFFFVRASKHKILSRPSHHINHVQCLARWPTFVTHLKTLDKEEWHLALSLLLVQRRRNKLKQNFSLAISRISAFWGGFFISKQRSSCNVAWLHHFPV